MNEKVWEGIGMDLSKNTVIPVSKITKRKSNLMKKKIAARYFRSKIRILANCRETIEVSQLVF